MFQVLKWDVAKNLTIFRKNWPFPGKRAKIFIIFATKNIIANELETLKEWLKNILKWTTTEKVTIFLKKDQHFRNHSTLKKNPFAASRNILLAINAIPLVANGIVFLFKRLQMTWYVKKIQNSILSIKGVKVYHLLAKRWTFSLSAFQKI